MASNTSSGSTYDGSMITSGYLKGKVVEFQAQGLKENLLKLNYLSDQFY